MKKYISLLTVVLLLLFSSCNNDLTEVVYSDITEQSFVWTPKDALSAIGAVYSELRGFHGFNEYQALAITADDIVYPANASGWSDGGKFLRMHQHNWNSEQDHLSSIWFLFYRGALNANRIINQFEAGTIPPPEGSTKEAIIAEMRAARAYYYWYLCDNFGDVPLIVGEVESTKPAKTPRAEVFKFIVEELKATIPNLSEDNSKKMYGRFNKWAAKTLLANVYLNAEVYSGQAKWNECITECNDIITSGKFILEADYSNPFKVRNENSAEIIFAIPFDQINAGGFYMHHSSLHASSKATFGLKTTPWGAGSFKAVTQFLDVYDKDDLRLPKTWLMGPQYAMDRVTPLLGAYDKQGEPLVYTREIKDGVYTPENEGYRWGKFEYEKGADFNLNNDWPVFRYAQVLLMKAECLLRTGQKDQAAQLVTQVRMRDFTDPAKANVTGDNLMGNTRIQYGYWENYKVVDPGNTTPVQYGRFLDELGAEFATEQYRRRDLIRFGIFTKKSWLSHKPNGDYRTVFPIPLIAINANDNLIQNPSYQ